MISKFSFSVLVVVNTICASVYSIVAPYLPTEASSKQIPPSLIGLMLSGYPLTAFISSLILAKNMRIQKQKILQIGCFLSSISILIYSLLPNTSYSTFLVIGFSFRILQGIGSGFIGTSILGIIANEKTEDFKKYLGIINISDVVGFMLGPLAASVLFALGGFSLIFFVFGLCFVFLQPVIFFFIKTEDGKNEKLNEISFFEIIKHKKIFVGLVVYFAAASSLCFLSPTYALHLKGFDLPVEYFGAIFAIPTFSYVASMIFVFKSSLGKRKIMQIGVFLIGLSNLLIGP